VTAGVGLIEWGRERARAGPWRGDARTAYLAPLPDAPPPSAGFLRQCLDTLAGRGFRSVVTGALAPGEQRPFLAAGFEEHERLHLLVHDLLELDDVESTVRIRRSGRRDRPAVLELDTAAFHPFWRLDRAGLEDAIRATPVSRFRVALHEDRGIVGYAVSGRAGRNGYLQRLAVHPDRQRAGLGRALTLDGLRWMRRHGSAQAAVNTQVGNEPALALYQRLGFRLKPGGLAVLRRDISP